MKQFLLLLSLVFSFSFSAIFAQGLQDNVRHSLFTYVYKLDSTAAAEIYSRRELRDSLKYFTNLVDSFPYNTAYDQAALKSGHYLFINGEENNVRYWLYETPLFLLRSVGANMELRVFAYDLKGNVIADARLKMIGSGKVITFQEDCGCYPIPLAGRKKLNPPIDFLLLKGSDFTYGSISYNNNELYPPKVKKQRNRHADRRYSGPGILPGYLVLNQPRFKLNDTLKWKAFLLKPNGKPYRKKVRVLVYNNSQNVLLKQQLLKPVSRGAYCGELFLADTLSLDNQYSLQLFRKRGGLLKSTYFQIENYDLKKAFFDATLNKNYFYAGEEIRFRVSTFDANKLPLLDAKINVLVNMSQLQDFFEDSLFVPFAWSQKFWEHNTLADPSGVTEIVFPVSLLPKARMQFNVPVTISLPEGESRILYLSFTYDPTTERYLISQDNDSIHAVFLQNSEAVKKTAVVKALNNGLLWEKEVNLPYSFKVEEFPTSYQLWSEGKYQAALDLQEGYVNTLGFEGSRSYDSVRFQLINPLGIKVNYKVFHGHELIDGGSATSLDYRRFQPSDLAFHVIYSFRWRGIEYVREASFQAEEKGLNVEIIQPEVIYPGQSVAVTVHVTDYKNKNVRKVNLAAYAINAQMQGISEPAMPYFGIGSSSLLKSFYTFNARAVINNYKPVTGFYTAMPFLAGSPYYTLVYNASGLGKVYETIDTDKAEFSPYVFKERENQSIYAVYVNKKLVYVSNTNVRNPYSFRVDPGVYEVQLRTHKRMITLRDVEFRKGKKLFLCLRDDSLTTIPGLTYVTMQPPFLKEEQASIAKHLLYFNPAFVKNAGKYYLVQGDRVYCGASFNQTNYVNEAGMYFVAGPFEKGPIQLVFPGKDSLEFYFVPGTACIFWDDSVTFRELPALQDKTPYVLSNVNSLSPMILNERAYPWPYIFGKHELVPPPLAEVKMKWVHPALHDNYDNWPNMPYADFYLKNLSTINIRKVWLFNQEDEVHSRIFFSPTLQISRLKPGKYDILILTEGDSICRFKDYLLQGDGSNYKFISRADFFPYDSILIAGAEERIVKLNRPVPRVFDNPPTAIKDVKRQLKEETKVTRLSGYVLDQNGNPIDMVTVFLENAGVFVAGAITNQLGYFEMDAGLNVAGQLKIFVNGKYYTLNQVFLATGKNTELQLRLPNAAGQAYGWLMAPTEISEKYVNYSSNSYTSSGAASVDHISAVSLESIVVSSMPGISFSRSMQKLGKLTAGIGSAADAETALADGAPKGNKFSEFLDKIKGDPNASRIRMNFRDYAYFIPNIFTDKKGEAHFTVVFPDNQTLWKTMVPAVDYHKRTGLGLSEIKAYKPLNATLAMPKFYVAHDSLKILGKVYNYTDKALALTAAFSIDNVVKTSGARTVKTFLTDSLVLNLPEVGNYQVSYAFETPDKYTDGEKRTLPVYVDGTEVVRGSNFLAERDTSLLIAPDSGQNKTTVTFTNNQLDLLVEQIEKLKNYQFGCNEQTASKLRALLTEKALLPAMGRTFTGDKLIWQGIRRLEKTQNKDGSWGWWNFADSPEHWMTNYIIEALEMAVQAGFHTRAHIRGAEFLRARLSSFEVTDRLYALEILSRFYNKLDYKAEVENFDSRNLSLQDQFRLMRLKQLMGISFSLAPLQNAMTISKSGVYWGEEVLDFKTNIIPTSALAYAILKNDSLSHEDILQKTRAYFLTHREMARNTIEQALMLQSIVGDVVAQNKIKAEINPELFLNGKPYPVQTFPHLLKLPSDKPSTLDKKGAPLYFSILHYGIESKPKVVDSLYRINAWLDQNGNITGNLKKSLPVNYYVEIKAARNTEYVMIEVPIPSSCFYADKSLGRMPYEVNREYFDNKVVIFCRNLPKGEHRLTVVLQPRFEGRSRLLPVKVSLMYYPDRYGINTKRDVSVKN